MEASCAMSLRDAIVSVRDHLPGNKIRRDPVICLTAWLGVFQAGERQGDQIWSNKIWPKKTLGNLERDTAAALLRNASLVQGEAGFPAR
jgi:hypothetical protein